MSFETRARIERGGNAGSPYARAQAGVSSRLQRGQTKGEARREALTFALVPADAAVLVAACRTRDGARYARAQHMAAFPEASICLPAGSRETPRTINSCKRADIVHGGPPRLPPYAGTPPNVGGTAALVPLPAPMAFTEGHAGLVHVVCVYPHSAGLERARHGVDEVDVVGEDARGEAVLVLVGALDDLAGRAREPAQANMAPLCS